MKKYYYYPLFMGEEMEAQRSYVNLFTVTQLERSKTGIETR